MDLFSVKMELFISNSGPLHDFSFIIFTIDLKKIAKLLFAGSFICRYVKKFSQFSCFSD